VLFRLLSLAVVCVCAVAVLAPRGSSGGAPPKPSPCGAVDLEPGDLGVERAMQVTLCLLSLERTNRGLPPLGRRAQLDVASERHSQDMVARRFFEHDTPEGATPQRRMLDAGYPSDNAVTGENIAWGAGELGTPRAIVKAWMLSPGHKENILRPQFTEIGIGLIAGAPAKQHTRKQAWTYTTDFGGPPELSGAPGAPPVQSGDSLGTGPVGRTAP
jgi:hypothetical protein